VAQREKEAAVELAEAEAIRARRERDEASKQASDVSRQPHLP